jgi:hypothetical protein
MKHLLFGTELYALPILRPLAAAIAARGEECRWFLPGIDRARLAADEVALPDAASAVAWQGDTVLSASNWAPPFVPGLKVQLFHGFSVDKRSESAGHFRIRGFFDLYCTQGPATTEPFARLAREHGHFRVVETGWPKLDPLFGAEPPDVAALRAPARGRPVVLFGSTFTPRLAAAPVLIDEIARLVARGDRYWLLTLHPKTAPEWFERYRALAGEHAAFVESDRLLPLLRAADALVADTSSIVSEFVVQRKAVVTFRHRVPRPHMLDIDDPGQLDAALARALAPDDALRAALAAYADAIHPARDGRASERVLAACRAVAADPPPRRKPLNAWRRLQIRRALHYWKF